MANITLACFLYVFFGVQEGRFQTQIFHALPCTRPVFGSAWATLPISPRRSKRWRRSGEARKNAAYGSYTLLYHFGEVQRFEFQFLGCWKGMFIPCLYHVYSVAQENGCTMASVFWISKHWVLEKIDARLVNVWLPSSRCGSITILSPRFLSLFLQWSNKGFKGRDGEVVCGWLASKPIDVVIRSWFPYNKGPSSMFKKAFGSIL